MAFTDNLSWLDIDIDDFEQLIYQLGIMPSATLGWVTWPWWRYRAAVVNVFVQF